MTLQTYIYKNILRNKRRTALTVLSIGFSLFLLIVLYTFLDLLLNPPMTEQSALRLAVKRSTSLADQMPMAYIEKVRKVPHVKQAIPLQWFNGVYKEPKNFFANFASDDTVFSMFPELQISEHDKQAFAREKTGAIVGEGLMSRFNWKVGDRVTLLGTIFPVNLEFLIVGTYNHEMDKNNFYFHYDYLNESLGSPNQVGAIWVMTDAMENVPQVAENIDALFRNSPAETKTDTEKAFVLGFVSMLGNVRVMVGSIMMVVVFTMLLVAASTMAMTIRERLREIAILKAIGYTRNGILYLILGESTLIGFLGFLTGSALAWSLNLIDLYKLTQGFIQVFKPGAQIYLICLAVGVGIGLISGAIPALQAANMTISEAARRLE